MQTSSQPEHPLSSQSPSMPERKTTTAKWNPDPATNFQKPEKRQCCRARTPMEELSEAHPPPTSTAMPRRKAWQYSADPITQMLREKAARSEVRKSEPQSADVCTA